MTKPPKPQLYLVRAKGITAEKLADLVERITGKKPTPEEIENSRALLGGRGKGSKPTAPLTSPNTATSK